MVFQADVLREPFELAGVLLGLLAIISGIFKVSNLIAELRIDIARVQTDVRGIRYRVDRIEEHLAPPARS